MRIALLSDIHGNRVALEAVLDRLEDEPLDQVVCLGDVAATGPEPTGCLELVQKLDGPVILGNTDQDLLGPPGSPFLVTPPEETLVEINDWCRTELDESHRDFLATLHDTHEVRLGDGTRLFCYHATPRSNTEALLATTPEDELSRMFDEVGARLCAGGHTHLQMVRRYRDKVLVNPGSVGMPFRLGEGGEVAGWALRAEYAILEATDGQLSIELGRLPVDREALEASVNASQMPHGEAWLANWA